MKTLHFSTFSIRYPVVEAVEETVEEKEEEAYFLNKLGSTKKI